MKTPGLWLGKPISTERNTMTHELLTAKEAAVYLGVKEPTIWAWLAAGKLPSVKIGAARRFEKSALDAIIDLGRCVSPDLP